MGKIKVWLESYIWPWTVIAQLRKERNDAIHNMHVCYNTYIDGYNAHWRKWIALTNQLYGPVLFNEGECLVMRRFYDDGFNSYDAIERLKEYQGIGRYAHHFSRYHN